MSLFTLKNCILLDKGKPVRRNLIIKDGKISKIASQDECLGEEIDICSNTVIPGAIDPHVHFREPGMTHKEDFLTGSRAAVSGGVTTFLDMPNTNPPTTTLGLLEQKRRLAAKSVADFGFHFGAAKANCSEIRKAANIASVKVFMNLSTGKMMIDDRKELGEIFRSFRLISVHAESSKVMDAVGLKREAGSELYLCHISSKHELDFLRNAKENGIYAEATPHHLFLTSDNDKDNFTKMKPELKSGADSEALWKAIDDGIIDTLGSDHAPHTIQEKNGKETVYGVPGVETMLPLMLDAVNKGRITLQRVLELCCSSPARIFRIRGKGRIKEGFDADLAVIDMSLEKKVENSSLNTRCGWSPFSGMVLKGWPVMTFVRGNLVYDKGRFFSNNGKEVVFDGEHYGE